MKLNMTNDTITKNQKEYDRAIKEKLDNDFFLGDVAGEINNLKKETLALKKEILLLKKEMQMRKYRLDSYLQAEGEEKDGDDKKI